MFHTVLVANRGEIAVRVIATLRGLGIRSVAVYSDADAGARHVREADLAVRIGPAEASESYLSIPAVLSAAAASGAEAIHPGYGFLAENAEFARACAARGITFIGPPPAAIEAMGDKITAKQTVAAAGVPVVPGIAGTPEELTRDAAQIGYPLLIKPSAGGGGKGMRLVTGAGELDAAIASARREAKAAFGDDTLLAERFVATPRHIEIQVLADAHGTAVHLGERECSLQRRHQKIIEEAPSALLDAAAAERMGAAAVDACRAVGYTGAGTVEFIVSGETGGSGRSGDGSGSSGDGPGETATQAREFFFLETNTRLQVEHPVTEMVTGIDLVEWQLRVAAGEALPFSSANLERSGHAVEARIYAEDPARGFMPTGGEVLDWVEPAGPGVRVDAGIHTGERIGAEYDPMLAKVIAAGPDREVALARLDTALAGTAVLGVATNVAFLRALLARAEVRSGALDTGLVERHLDELTGGEVPAEVFAAAALDRLLALWPRGPVVDPWTVPSGWRLGGAAGVTFLLQVGGDPSGDLQSGAGQAGGHESGEPVEVWVGGTPDDALVRVGDGEPGPAWARWQAPRPGTGGPGQEQAGAGVLEASVGGVLRRYRRAAEPDGTLWLAAEGRALAVRERPRLLASHAEAAAAGPVTSPMPGTVIAVHAECGERVGEGAALVVVEAMKMEHTVAAPMAGVVTEVHVTAGQRVGRDERLAVLSAAEDAGTGDSAAAGDGTGEHTGTSAGDREER